MKNVKISAKERLEAVLRRKVEAMKGLFLSEVQNMLKQFYALKDENAAFRKQIEQQREVLGLQERHIGELRSVWEQHALKEKEDHDTIARLKEYKLYDPTLRKFEFRVEKNPFARAEKFLENPLHFYDSYLNLSETVRDQVAERKLVHFYKEQMLQMQDTVEQLEAQLQTAHMLGQLHTEHELSSEQNVAQYRQQSEDAMRLKDREVERVERQLQEQHVDFVTEKKEMQERFEKYKLITQREIEVNEQIRARQQQDIATLQEELLQLRNIIRQPRLHYKLMETLGYEQLLNAYAEREQSSEKKEAASGRAGAGASVVNINFEQKTVPRPKRVKARNLDSAVTSTSVMAPSVAPSLSAFSDMPPTKRALYTLRHAKKLGGGSATPSVSTFSRSTAVGTNIPPSVRGGGPAEFDTGSVNRSFGGWEDSISATGVSQVISRRAHKPPLANYTALGLK